MLLENNRPPGFSYKKLNSKRLIWNKSNYKALFIITFSVSLGLSAVNPFFPIYVKNMGISGLTIALMFSGYSLAKVLFMPVLGRWSDLKNRKNFIVAGLGIYSIISLCFLFLPNNIPFLIFLRFIQGMAAALVRPLALSFVGDTATRKHEGSLMGTFDVSFYSALAAGPVIGGFVHDIYGFPGIFLIWFILCCLSLLIGLTGISRIENTLQTTNKTAINYKIISESRTLQGLFCFIFSRSFGIVLVAIFLPLHMHSGLNLSSIQIGVIMTFGSILIPVFLRPMGKLSDRVDRRLLVIIGGSLTAVSILFLPFAADFWQLLILSSCIGFFSVLSLPASSALVVEEGNRYGMGLTIGLFNSVMNIGFILAPLVGGFLMDKAGISCIFYFAGGAGLLGIYFFSLSCPTPESEKMAVLEKCAK